MLEYYDKYKEAPRKETSSAIDKPMLIFLGLALTDFIAGVAAFLAIVMFWDSGVAIPVAMGSGVLSAWGSREYRRRFPARFLTHWNWSLGLQRIRGVPSFFTKRRHAIFGP